MRLSEFKVNILNSIQLGYLVNILEWRENRSVLGGELVMTVRMKLFAFLST